MCRENQIVVPRMNCQVANRNGWKMVALELCPAASAIDRNPESEFRAKEKKIGLNQIFLDHVRVSTNALRVLWRNECRPGFTKIGRLKNVRSHVAKRMPIEGGVRGAGIKVASLDPIHPRVLWQTGDVADNVGPRLSAVARELKIA